MLGYLKGIFRVKPKSNPGESTFPFPHARPSWDEYFLAIAFLVSSRSNDPTTHHGCVITSRNIIIGTGYNGLMAGVDTSHFDLTRPAKYDFMIHAEENALLNVSQSVKFSQDVKAYVTGRCCNTCLQRLIQAGVGTIVMADRKATQLESAETHKQFDHIVRESGVKVVWIPVVSIAKVFDDRGFGRNS